jgi:hypothetical protein
MELRKAFVKQRSDTHYERIASIIRLAIYEGAGFIEDSAEQHQEHIILGEHGHYKCKKACLQAFL